MLKEHRQFIGICALMGLRQQPSYQDYWRRSSSTLYCNEVAKTMTREQFQHLLRLIHVTNKDTFVTDKSSPKYDPIGKIRWLLENLVKNYRAHFNPSEFICADESMIQYNGRYCVVIQYMPLKPITHRIKVLALACSQTKFVFKLEATLGLPRNQRYTRTAGASSTEAAPEL
jgi:hypothetical protein